MSVNNEPIKFAYWVPNVSGGLVISSIEQRTSWDIDYNRKLAQIAEKAGFDYALSQIRFAAGYGADKQHEPVSFSHALLAATEKLKVIAALLPGPWNPAVAAKQIATISQLTNARVSVNIVSGWFRGEFHAIGEPWFDHDERCRRSEEFINALRGIWTEESFTLNGDFYRFNEYSLKPKPLDPLPEIFQGGSSRAARDMAARVSDWYFTNGNTPEGLKAQVEDIRSKEKAFGKSFKTKSESMHSASSGKPKRKPRTSCRKSSTRRSPMQFAASTTRSRTPATPAPSERATGPSPPSRISFNTTTASART